jgi:hypothetical protein
MSQRDQIVPAGTLNELDVLPESSQKGEVSDFNIGAIPVRAIVANISEVGNKYGSYGMKYSQSKLTEVDQALQGLNEFVKQSSYGKAQLQWTTSGIYDLGGGVCNQASYGDKVNDLIRRALNKADLETPLVDYSYYLIVHPMPDCPDGVAWSFEGRGQFSEYNVNGRTVHLRGTHISDLSDQYLFHEFGHSLAYKPNMGIGHPDFMTCPLSLNKEKVLISITRTCPRVADFYSNNLPTFTIMSSSGVLSDYSAIEKEIAGWLKNDDIILSPKGDYSLSPVEQSGSAPKALKIAIPNTDYSVYVSFRQPSGYVYPATPPGKPNGVILEITNGSVISLLVADNTNKNASLKIGTEYQLGEGGPIVKVNGISDNLASVTVTAN